MSFATTADALRAALNFQRAGDLSRAEPIYRQVLLAEPNNPSALHYLGLIEQHRGNLAVAVELIRKSVQLKPDQSAAWNNLGNALGELRRIDEAIDSYQHAVQVKPDYPLALQNLARVLHRAGNVSESIAASEQQLKLQPNNATALWNIELCRRELAAKSAPKIAPADRPDKWFTIIVVCYGDFPQYSVRCVDSLVATPGLLDRCDLHVGCNACSPRTIAPLRAHLDAGKITTLLEANRNLHKDPVLRTMLGITRTPYALMLDDDTHVEPGWLEAMISFLETNHPFDVAGDIYSIDRAPEYQKLVDPKPWWRGVDVGHPAYRSHVFFATGGMVLARVEFLRQHNFPDRSMIIWRDDAMLGDLTNQQGGKLLRYDSSILQRVRINDAKRRGEDIMTIVEATPEDFSTGF
jgi:tetratricopeptide (TPR) repeat protein